ncbi:hypothetical protein BDW62DRAFT_113001 [Aspergillus aurantiobrunneus]
MLKEDRVEEGEDGDETREDKEKHKSSRRREPWRSVRSVKRWEERSPDEGECAGWLSSGIIQVLVFYGVPSISVPLRN